ncbi:glycohydrolase toxin TNT-related protein [Listeria booriae]|uniref:glycohydrolase toxin TNT-related protein n=1 Tax=Listeria booriae TaxID=1552123 RepID=UPI001C8A4402|nr:glycohydrolase toxin TNT-related protein [Listeria booriae]
MDFKINMGELEDVLTSLYKMKSSLETLDGVLVNVQNAIAKQQGKLADALTMEFGAHRDYISRQQGTVTKLYTYLEKYVNDLKSIDSPTYRNQDMLIDARGLQKAAEMQRDILDEAKSDVFRVPQPSIGTIPDDPDELWVMRHNQGLMEDLDDYLRQKLMQLQQNEGEAMHRISLDMRRLMEMDRAHASGIEKDYRQYDRNKVRQIGASTRDSVFGFGKRAIESLKHPEKHLESMAMLMKNLRSDPSGTMGMFWDGIVSSYLEPYKKGDAYGLASTTIFLASMFGITKGVNDFSKIKNVKDVSASSKVNTLSEDVGAFVKPFSPKKIVLENGEIAYESKWGELVRSPNYLDGAGEIMWPAANGFIVDKTGRAITINADLKAGQIVDRYGDAGGRFTSPVEGGKILDYDTRGLPYPESSMKYHQYEVLKDITETNIKTAYSKSSKEVQTKIDQVMDKWGLNFEDLANPQQGKVAQVFEAGGGVQIRFITSVKYYEQLGLIKEIK